MNRRLAPTPIERLENALETLGELILATEEELEDMHADYAEMEEQLNALLDRRQRNSGGQ